MSGIEWIGQHYGVPARLRGRVIADGKPGTITGTSGPHLLIRIDGNKYSQPYHPTWHMEYLPCPETSSHPYK